MRYLFISGGYPEYDRNAADFRLRLLMMKVSEHRAVDFLAIDEHRQAASIGPNELVRYRNALIDMGIEILRGGLAASLRSREYEAVIIEWYFSAAPQIDLIRSMLPQAKIITDSVDVVFNRLRAKARVSGLIEDARNAEKVRSSEINTYRRSDLVLTVSDEDSQILASEDPSINCVTIPNIHPLQNIVQIAPDAANVLIFVGSKSEANDDAMQYFCEDVLPMILALEPSTILRVVGTVTLPPLRPEIDKHVERLGRVPDTRPFLESSLISIAPLRFGGGMKGKVGEAMSLGLPVVSTSIGAEGFGMVPGRDALVADSPRAFAEAVVELIRDSHLRDSLRTSGWNFIRDNYSDVAVRKRICNLIHSIGETTPKRLPCRRRSALLLRSLWNRHISWRFR